MGMTKQHLELEVLRLHGVMASAAACHAIEKARAILNKALVTGELRKSVGKRAVRT